MGDRNSRTVAVFRGKRLPREAVLAGYSALIDTYDLKLPTPPRLSAIAGVRRPVEEGGWLILPERYVPAGNLASQITYGLKWEGLNLAVLDALFDTIEKSALEDAIRGSPTGAYMRRLWFTYEWLRDETLDLSDLQKVKAVDLVDTDQQIALAAGALSSRHKIRNNLPGTRAFCPMVRRSPAIREFENAQLSDRAQAVLRRTHPDVISRAAAFLLLSDSRASYRIEGEEPSLDRARRWGQAIARAGSTRVSLEELETLQRIVIGDSRFVKPGLRDEGGFVGEHDRVSNAPLPDHISARHDDLPSLIRGVVDYDQRAGGGGMDAVVAAAVEAFGFVYIHPFEDGNGRIHRWLIHHILAASGFAPSEIAFPVSAVMLREINAYRIALESYSRPLLNEIQWRPTEKGNVEVLNDTASWYRYFDATAHAEFLYQCVATTIAEDLPREIAFLEAYDRFVERVSGIVDMPSRTLSLLHKFLLQNEGRLSRRGREKEFAALTDAEAGQIESIFRDVHSCTETA